MRGLKCPLPVLYTRRALRRMAPGETLTVTCTDPLAAIDIPHFVQSDRHHLKAQAIDRAASRFVIVKGGVSDED